MGWRLSASLVSDPSTTCVAVALPEAGTLRLAAVPASVTLAMTCVWLAAAAPIEAGVMWSACPEACEAAWLVGALLSVRRLSLVATAPMLDGVIGSLPADAWDAAWLDGGPPPSAAMAPSVTLEVRLPSALSAGTTAVGFADAAGSDEMVVSGISISP